MDPINPISPTLQIQPLTAYQNSGQQQRLPFSFTQGQVLQGMVSAHSGANQFTIDIGGHQILAESTAGLQVGQKLNLQVTTLVPQIELQIVNTPAVTRMIGNAIHLIGQQSVTMPGLTELAEKATLLPQLSTSSKETLQLYANSIANPSLESAPSIIATQLFVQLLNGTLEALTTPQGMSKDTLYAGIGNLLQQLLQTSAFTPESAAHATNLAPLFAQMSDPSSQASASLLTATDTSAFLSAGETISRLNAFGKLFQGNTQIQNLISQLIPFIQDDSALPAAHPLQQLLTLLNRLKSETVETQPLQVDGRQLEKIINRLGITMEQSLANGNQEKAVQTLKFALLELSQQLPAGEKGLPQTEQIAKTIELYQLLQIRLASESLVFIPLPFSFLNQGYLLVDADHSKNEPEAKTGKEGKTTKLYELHLQLEGLGNLQIDIRQQDGKLSLKFLTEDTQRAKFLASFRDQLGQWLTAASLESAQFLVGAKEPVKSLLEKIMSDATGMVDTKA